MFLNLCLSGFRIGLLASHIAAALFGRLRGPSEWSWCQCRDGAAGPDDEEIRRQHYM